jgi:hypothetical protein
MKPGGQAAPGPRLRWLGPLRGPVERLLSGGPAPNDPLYLTNRTVGQKLKSWGLIAIPCLILVGGVAYVLRSLNPGEAAPPKEPTAAETAAKLPLPKDFKLGPASDVKVVEVHVESAQLVGSVENTSAREIALVQLVVDLVSDAGSQVGAVEVIVEHLPASGKKDFRIPIKQRNATFGMVREVNTH